VRGRAAHWRPTFLRHTLEAHVTASLNSVNRRLFLQHTAQTALAFGILRQVGACRPARSGDPELRALRDRYFLTHLELNPVTSTYLGGDGYSPALAAINGRLRDWSPAGLAGEVRVWRETQRALAAIHPARLSGPDRVDYEVIRAQLDYLLHQLDARRYHERCVDTYVAEPFRGADWQIQQMTDAGSGLLGTEEEWHAVVNRLRAVPAYVATAQANLRAGKAAGNLPDRRMIELDGVAGSQASAEYFVRTLPETAHRLLGGRAFAGTMLGRVGEAGRAAADAYRGFAAFLASELTLPGRTDRFAVGEAEYEWRVRTCLRDPRGAAALYEYGAEQVALYEDQAFRVAEEVAREGGPARAWGNADRRASVRAVMEHLSGDAPKNDDELFRWYRDTAARLVEYGRAHALFDVPAEYRLDIVPTPPVLRATIEAAYYPAPPFKHSGVGRFYLTPTGNDPAQLQLNNRASVADLAAHEGFPGHDWHYKYMTEHAAEISNVRWLTPGAVEDSFSMWEDSMASEGWALYAEELMAEPAPGRPHGFYTAAEHLYELQGQLLRAARVRVDVGIHTGRISFDEAVDYFTEHVSFYPRACAHADRDPAARAICEGARRALYRYSKWPTQAITYNLGKNAIVGLREEARRRGATASAQEFHERFMRMGTIPAGYFRETFLAE